jgi:hypothetical protein
MYSNVRIIDLSTTHQSIDALPAPTLSSVPCLRVLIIMFAVLFAYDFIISALFSRHGCDSGRINNDIPVRGINQNKTLTLQTAPLYNELPPLPDMTNM